MRVWLDDIRPVPPDFDKWVKTAEEAIDLLRTGEVTFISLDHDLLPGHYMESGLDEGTGYQVATFIEHEVKMGRIPMPGWACHSASLRGRQRIIMAMTEAGRYHPVSEEP